MAQASNRIVRGLQGVFVAAALVVAGCSSADSAPLTRTGSHAPAGKTPAGPGTGDPNGATTGNDAGTDPTPAPSGPPVTSDDTWADGKMLTMSVVIASGVTVTIAPGATITAASGVTVTVNGTLTASSAAKHAKITGTGWTGIVVGMAGTLKLDGVDIDGAATGLDIQGGNAAATYDNGKLTSTIPFKLEKGSKLSTTHASAVAGGTSQIDGAFTASHLDYDKGSNEGLQMSEATASMFIEDSTLHGNGGGDYLVASGGTLIHLAYSIVSGSHCPFHFNTLSKYEMDHVTADTNGYGAMLYNSDIGPNTIVHSNFGGPGALKNMVHDLELTAPNSVLKLTGVYLGSGNTTFDGMPSDGKTVPASVKNVTITTPATVAWTDAKPR